MRWLARRVVGERGTATVEYALMTIVGSALVVALYKIATSSMVSAGFTRIIQAGLSAL